MPQAVQAATGQRVELASVDQGSTGEQPAAAEVAKHPESTQGLVLLPQRRVVECSFAGKRRFARLVWDEERLTTTVRLRCCWKRFTGSSQAQ